MKSSSGTIWRMKSIPDRLILKNKQNFNISYLLSKIFIANNYTDEEIYNSLTDDSDNNISYINSDFAKAAKILFECIENQEKILIFGDYDVDGYSSTYILYDFLKQQNLNCDYYIPNRFKDGYGPNINLLKKLLFNKKYNLVFFVDCGSNASEEINFLENKGINVIVIDHHKLYKKKIYKRAIIINPFKDLAHDQYFFFCATTLVYFFLKYLSNFFLQENSLNFNKYLFFSAIATICDQMPLRNINKLIVKKGLNKFNVNNFKNFKNIFKTNQRITSHDIAFNLGPILNSSSRLGHSMLVIRLLTDKKTKTINKLSEQIKLLNEKRKNIQNRTFNLLNNKVQIKINEVIFINENYINEGMIGIVAAKFVDLYNKPSFILTNSNNFVKCSCRSVVNFDVGNILNNALDQNIIIKGGGHSMAGGCLMYKDKVNDFKKFLNNIYKKKFNKIENIRSYISEQNFSSLKLFAKNELFKLEPFGNTNVNPFFLIKNVKIIKFKILGDAHLQLILMNQSKKTCLSMAFNTVGTKLGETLMQSKNKMHFIVQINNKIIKKNSDFNLIIKDAIA